MWSCIVSNLVGKSLNSRWDISIRLMVTHPSGIGLVGGSIFCDAVVGIVMMKLQMYSTLINVLLR